MLTPPTERGLKDGYVSMGGVNQGYANFYDDVDGIAVDPDVGNSVNLFVNLGPLGPPKKKERTTKLKAELDSSRKSRKKTAIQQHPKENNSPLQVASRPCRR